MMLDLLDTDFSFTNHPEIHFEKILFILLKILQEEEYSKFDY